MARPERLGRYKIVRLLARGGVAEVYLAKLEGPGGFSRPVAVKRLKDVYRHEPSYRRQLIAEARVGALLDHPNILTYVELCEADDRELFIVTEYLHGVTTRQLIHTAATRGEFLGVALALHITAELLEALSWAHEAVDDRGMPMRLVHRDISPENVFLSLNGAIKLIDFGIAETPLAPRDTHLHVVKGKARYFSPEQARGNELDAGSDVYSVGLMLFELLTGTPAIDGDTERDVLERAARCELASAVEMRPELPAPVLELLQTALSPEVSRRYPGARLMLAAVRAALAQAGGDRGRAELDTALRRFFGDELETRRRSIWSDRATAIVDVADIERDALPGSRTAPPLASPMPSPDAEAASFDPEPPDTLAEMDIAEEPAAPERPSSLGFDRLRRAVSDAYASTPDRAGRDD